MCQRQTPHFEFHLPLPLFLPRDGRHGGGGRPISLGRLASAQPLSSSAGFQTCKLCPQVFSLGEGQFSSVQFSHSVVSDSATSWTAAHQASLSITNSWSPPKLMSVESVMPSNHLILSHPLLLLPSIFPSIGVFSNESVLPIRWPKYWSFSFNISPANEHPD